MTGDDVTIYQCLTLGRTNPVDGIGEHGQVLKRRHELGGVLGLIERRLVKAVEG